MLNYDSQATRFDTRSGLPKDVVPAIAKGLVAMTELKSEFRILDLGAGTGVLGEQLSKAGGVYCGFDNSIKMLSIFATKTKEKKKLVRGNANLTWPFKKNSFNIIFASRSLHLLDPSNAISEIERVSASGSPAYLIVGQIKREKNGLKSQMRLKMRELLQSRGYFGKSGPDKKHQVLDFYREKVQSGLPAWQSEFWEVTSAPRDSLQSWEQKESLDGIKIPSQIKHEILSELKDWAKTVFGNLSHKQVSRECYTLEGASIND